MGRGKQQRGGRARHPGRGGGRGAGAREESEEARAARLNHINSLVQPRIPHMPSSSSEEDDEEEDQAAQLKRERQEQWRMLNAIWLHNHSERQLAAQPGLIEKVFRHRNQSAAGSPIARVDGADASQLASFAEKYVATATPAMISGLADGWGAAEKWASADALLEHHGSVPLFFTELDGQPLRLPLEEYVQYARDNSADAPYYLFEPDMRGDPERAAMAQDYQTPQPFVDDLYRYHRACMPCNAYLIVGSDRTGSNLHVDPAGTAAWNTLLCGRKKWCLFPPGSAPSYRKQMGAVEGYKTTPPLYWWLDACAYTEQTGLPQVFVH